MSARNIHVMPLARDFWDIPKGTVRPGKFRPKPADVANKGNLSG